MKKLKALKMFNDNSQVQWFLPIILELRRQRQEDCKVKASPDYTVRPYQRTKTINTKVLFSDCSPNRSSSIVSEAVY